MASGEYSFIDISVLDEVRERFARGDALAILSVSLEEILWANGPGAALFGYADIEAIMGASTDLSPAARRQIAATPGFPAIGKERPVLVRIASGLTSRATEFSASEMRLPDGQRAILLSRRAPDHVSRAPDAIAAHAIEGITSLGHYAAMIDRNGDAVAASPGFAGLGITRTTLRDLVIEVAAEVGRVVKRMVSAGTTTLPCGFARLTDDPALHFMIVVDEAALGFDEEEPEAIEPPAKAWTVPPAHNLPVAGEITPVASPVEERPEAPEQLAAATSPVEEAAAAAPEPPRPETAAQQPTPSSAPLRFVWRTDPAGALTSISPEFLAVVGRSEDAVVGKSFTTLSEELRLGAGTEISALLERRDTWSGRTIYWPDPRGLVIPVDLAALPVYGRDRNFEGFRGFGVARLGDATQRPVEPVVEDAPPVADEAARPAEIESDPFRGERPALAVVPTQERRTTDKVIRLAEHRGSSADRALTPTERIAFEEIGERLRGIDGDGPVDAPTLASSGDGDAGTVEPEDATATASAAEPEPQPETIADTPPASGRTRPVRSRNFVPSAFGGSETPRQPVKSDTTILSRLPTPILIHSGDTLHYANAAFLDLCGHPTLEALGAAGGLDGLFADPLDGSGPEDRRELVLRRADGTMTPVEALLHAVPWEDGRALMLALRETSGAQANFAGITRVQVSPLDAELRARVAEMRTILDTATDGVVLIANDGMIRSINRPAEALFGFESDEVIGKPFTSLFAVESQRAARDYLDGLADNGVASVLNDGLEVIGREAEGRFIPLFMTIGRLPGDGGYCAVMRDITQWKRAEEELTQARTQAERASSQKTEFLARISHEIRTPLNAIIGFSELMLDEKFGPVGNDRYRDYLRDINRSGALVLDLVNDLLDISKIEAGEQQMSYEALSLNDTLSEIVAMMQPQANRERVIIRSSFASHLPEIVADPRSIRQIALNLLSNAIRYTQAGGQVIISTAFEASGDVVLRVRDTGIGMSQQEIEQAMKPFQQLNTIKRPRGDGTGLGLPLTKAMVEANRARFSILSTPGEGTLVEVTFPSTRVLAE